MSALKEEALKAASDLMIGRVNAPEQVIQRATRDAILAYLEAAKVEGGETPLGAIHNGRVFIQRALANEADADRGLDDWKEAARCFEHLAQWAEAHTPPNPSDDGLRAKVIEDAQSHLRNRGFREAACALDALRTDSKPSQDVGEPAVEAEVTRDAPAGGEAVAWRVRDFSGEWIVIGKEKLATDLREDGHLVECLYTHPAPLREADRDPAAAFAAWVNEGPRLAKAAGCHVGIKITGGAK